MRKRDFKIVNKLILLQNRVDELNGNALLTAVSINSAIINHLLKSLENKKSIKKDYGSITLVIRDDISAEAIEFFK